MKYTFKLTYLLFFAILLSTLYSCKENSNNTTNDATITSTDTIPTEIEPVKDTVTTKKEPKDLVAAKDETKLNNAQLAVQDLLEACVDKNYTKAAEVIMYRGQDASRKFVDSFNPNTPSELKTVEVTCSVIEAWLDESKSYEFISYKETEEGVHEVEVLFVNEKLGLNRKFFQMISTEKGMLLANIK